MGEEKKRCSGVDCLRRKEKKTEGIENVKDKGQRKKDGRT